MSVHRETVILNITVLLKNWKNGILVKDLNLLLSRKFGFGIDPHQYGFDTILDFLQDVSKDGEIILKNDRVQLKTDFEAEIFQQEEKVEDEVHEKLPIDLENEVFQEINRLNLEVNFCFSIKYPL